MPLATRLAYGTSIAPFQPTLACTAVELRWWSSSTSRRSPRGVRRRSASVLPPRAGTISTFSPDCVFRRTFSLTISSPEPKLSSSTTNLAMEADVAETVKTASIVTSMRRDETMVCEAVRYTLAPNSAVLANCSCGSYAGKMCANEADDAQRREPKLSGAY